MAPTDGRVDKPERRRGCHCTDRQQRRNDMRLTWTFAMTAVKWLK